jgi:hypothetical protein
MDANAFEMLVLPALRGVLLGLVAGGLLLKLTAILRALIGPAGPARRPAAGAGAPAAGRSRGRGAGGPGRSRRSVRGPRPRHRRHLGQERLHGRDLA